MPGTYRRAGSPEDKLFKASHKTDPKTGLLVCKTKKCPFCSKKA